MDYVLDYLLTGLLLGTFLLFVLAMLATMAWSFLLTWRAKRPLPAHPLAIRCPCPTCKAWRYRAYRGAEVKKARSR